MSQIDISRLAVLAKHIQDLDELVSQLLKGLPRMNPWHRRIASHLTDAERQLQVLRMTVSMDKPVGEIWNAGHQLARTCRFAAASLAGTRADATTRAAVLLAADLAERIGRALTEIVDERGG